MISFTKVRKLKGCATFRDFVWLNDLQPFSRYNLIYGWNASGKTTLSRVLGCLESQSSPDCDQVSIELSDSSILSKADFARWNATAIRVFNRDFIAANVFPENGVVPPVFVLGEQSKDDQAELETNQAKLPETVAKLSAARNAKTKADKAVEDHEKDRAKAIKDVLQPSGIDPFKNYNQGHYRSAAQNALKLDGSEHNRLTEPRRKEIRALITQQPLPKLVPLEEWQKLPERFREEVNALLRESVTAAVIPALREDARLSIWVEQGLALHPANDRANCKFCGEPIAADRIRYLYAIFNVALSGLNPKLDSATKEIELADREVPRSAPNKAELYSNLQLTYESELKKVRDLEKELRKNHKILLNALSKKSDNPFSSVPEILPFEPLDTTSVIAANAAIESHNGQTDNLKKTKEGACNEWEADIIAASLRSYKEKLSARAEADNDVTALAREEADLRHRIAQLNQQLRQHRTAAEDLNKDLHDYLGHSEISFKVHETGYQVMRGEVPAARLSEGERAAIAILYFLRTFDDTSFNLKNGIVVLDDPVSSLDENSMFSAFGYIQRRTRDAGQLMILTHNFTFFRMVKNWFKHENGRKADDHADAKARFYMLSCRELAGVRASSVRRLDTLLRDYESDYHYLFSVVREASLQPESDFERHYQLPNVARRLLESFLTFKHPGVEGDLHKLLLPVAFDEPKKAAILRFCHTHSHARAVPSPEHDATVLAETPAIMKYVLDLMQALDQAHYDGLEALFTPLPPPGGRRA